MLLFGGSGFSKTLEKCSLCNSPDVDVEHVLCNCPGTSPQYMQLSRLTTVPGRTNKKSFVSCIFGSSALPRDRLYHMMYVSKALQATLSLAEVTPEDIEELINGAFLLAREETPSAPSDLPQMGK